MSKGNKELYVGSLSYDTTEYDLEKLFSVSGRVTSIHLIVDLKTGEFKGCGYVRMSTEAEAKDAVASLDGAMLIDRKITVSIANPVKPKTAGGGYKGKKPWAESPAGAKALGKPAAKGAAKPQKTAAPKPAAAKPVAKAATAKPASSKPAFAKAEAGRPAAFKSEAAKAGSDRSDGGRSAFSKSDSPKSGFSKPGPSTKPSSPKSGFAKPGPAKSGPSRGGKR
jgi:RNA recognition motif-containing protein